MSKLAIGLLTLLAANNPVVNQNHLSPVRSEFEVASVRPSTHPDGRSLLEAVQGRLAMTNMPLRRMLIIAYGLQDYQLAGGPAWTGSEHYDIQAKADGNPSVQQMEGPMLQALLADRFKLATHQEKRQLPIYELVVVKGDPKLQPSKEGSCTPYAVDASPMPLPPGGAIPNFCGLRLTVNGLNRTLDGKGVTMSMLATNLAHTYTAELGRNVIDVTGFNGTFDIHLTWAVEPLGDSGARVAEADGLSIFTALQEQLGLKLKAGRAPVEVVVIESAEKPSAN